MQDKVVDTVKLLLKVPLGAYSGWGQDGIGLTMAIQHAGINPLLLPVEVTPPLPVPVARQLVSPLIPPFDFLLAHVAADRAILTSAELATSQARVLWSMWEWTSFQNHPAIETIQRALHSYNVIVAYDPVSAGAFSAILPPNITLLEVQGGFDSAPWRFIERSWRPPIRFFMAGHLTDRKNPMAALNAFGQLLEEHGPERFAAELHFKIIDRSSPFLTADSGVYTHAYEIELLHPPAREFIEIARKRERVFVYAGTWSKEAMNRFYACMHCLLAPSRGEGKNLVALEFLATGGAVIATNFGGHTVWLDESYAYPLRYALRPATWPIPTVNAQEAEPDIQHLKELMWRVYSDPEEARGKGLLASSVIPSKCDWSSSLRRLFAGLVSVGLDVTVPLSS